MNKNDYAIGLTKTVKGELKPFLFKVSSQTKGIVSGILEKDSHIPSRKKIIEVPVKDVILNLGSDPHPGKVYNCDTAVLYRGKKLHDIFGQIYFFYKPLPEIGVDLFKAFDKVYKVLKQARLDFIIEPDTCLWEILPFTGGKYAGMYKRSSKLEVSPHRLQIHPEMMPTVEYPYVIFHELGHHLHKEFATGTKLNAAWVQLYNTSIKVTSIKKEQSLELLEGLLSQEDLPSDFKSSLSEEDTLAYNLILKHINKQHSLSVKELDLLFGADYKDDIRSVWPTRGIPKKDLDPIVSEYACTKVQELVAESIAFKLSGMKLPKVVDALVERTFSYARSNYEKRSN